MRWIPPLHAWAGILPHTTLTHVPCQAVAWSIKEGPVSLPLNHHCSPLMLLAGHSPCGKGRVGARDRSCCSEQGECGRCVLYLAPVLMCTMRGTKTQCEEERKEWLLGMLLEHDGFGCFTRSGFPPAAPGGDGWAASPALLPFLDASSSKTWLLLVGGGNNCLSAKIKNPFSICLWSRLGD